MEDGANELCLDATRPDAADFAASSEVSDRRSAGVGETDPTAAITDDDVGHDEISVIRTLDAGVRRASVDALHADPLVETAQTVLISANARTSTLSTRKARHGSRHGSFDSNSQGSILDASSALQADILEHHLNPTVSTGMSKEKESQARRTAMKDFSGPQLTDGNVSSGEVRSPESRNGVNRRRESTLLANLNMKTSLSKG